MSTIQPSQLASEIMKALEEYAGVTDEAAAAGVSETAKIVTNLLREAQPSGSGKYGSWDAYNADWNHKKQKGGSGVYGEVVYNQKHYQLAHLLEKGHALRGGGRAQAFPHIAPVAEEAEDILLNAIKKHIKQS